MDDPAQLNPKSHVFRPGPFRAVRAYWLDGDALHWRSGTRKGQVALRDIASLRLNLVPETAEHSSRCEIVERSGQRHHITDRYWLRRGTGGKWRPGAHERRTASFAGLVFPLARELARRNPEAVLLAGPGRGEWLTNIVVGAGAVAILLGGAALMLARGAVSWPVLAFLALVAVYLPMLWPAIRSGGPRPLDPESLPRAGAPGD